MQITHRIQAPPQISPPQFHLLVNSYFPSPFWKRNEFNEISLISLKLRTMPFPLLVAEMQLKSKLHVIELEKIYSSIFLLWTIFLGNIFLIIGSLMNAYERELKLSNHDNENASAENVISPFCNHFWVSRMFQVTHLACWVSLCYPGIKF